MIQYFKADGSNILAIDAMEKGCWVSVQSPTKAETEFLVRELGVDEGFVRSSLDEEETSRIEKEDDQTLIIVDVPVAQKQEEHTSANTILYYTMPIGFVVMPDCIITISVSESPILSEVSVGLMRGVRTHYKTNFLLMVLLRIATRYIQYLKQIDKISYITELQLRKSMRNKELIQLLSLEKSLVYFSTALKATEATLEKVLRGRIIKLYEEDEELLEDVLIEIKQAIETCSIYSGILSSTMGAVASVISNNMNVVMKVLTAITFVMAVPTMVFSFYGMNVPLPMAGAWFFPMALTAVLCVIVAVVMFKKGFFSE